MNSSWSTQPIFDSAPLVIALVVLMGAFLLVRPSLQTTNHRRRLTLVGLRGVVIFLLLIAMLRPTHISTTAEPQSAVLVLLFDQSRSMQLPSGIENKSRWEVQSESLQRVHSLLKELSKDIEIRLYAYDQGLVEIPFDGATIVFPELPTGEQTDIGSALHEALRRELGNRIAGVILLGDGAQTAFEPTVEILEAGRELGRLDYPLYTIAFGLPGDLNDSRDVSVENLPEQYSVFAKNKLAIQAHLRSRGFANKEIPVELLIEDSSGQQQSLATRRIKIPTDQKLVPITLSHIPTIPGKYRLIVRAAEQPGELVTKNNQLTSFLTVLEGGVKILYMDSWPPRIETRFVRNAIGQSPDMELHEFLVDAESPASLPRVEELIDDELDALILGDVDATVLGRDLQQAIEAAVGNGTGFLMTGGFHSFGPGGYRGTALEDVLPIEINQFERQDLEAPIRWDLHLEGLLKVTPTTNHSITLLDTVARNAAIWDTLPPLNGANRFHQIKETPGVRVLATSQHGDPLLVSGAYGRGRVLAFAGDSTYLWSRHGFELQHRRFWRQVVLWLVRREDQEQSNVWIQMPQRRFNPGSNFRFDAGAKSAAGDTIADAKFSATLSLPDGSTATVRLSSHGAIVQGVVNRLRLPGDYTVHLTAQREGQAIGSTRADFQVFDQDVELGNPAADPDQLTQLADLTESAGGKAVAAEELPQLLEMIQRAPPELVIDVETKWQFADTAWEAWIFFLGLVSVLTAEWGLRKKWGLV